VLRYHNGAAIALTVPGHAGKRAGHWQGDGIGMEAKGCGPQQFRFGRFVLEPGRRALTANGKTVTLSARAFDLLCLLVQNRDQVVTKDALRAEVWRGLAVDDNNLAVQISVLRRALGEKSGDPPFIVTVPGQGYQFVARIDGEIVQAGQAVPLASTVPGAVPGAIVGPPLLSADEGQTGTRPTAAAQGLTTRRRPAWPGLLGAAALAVAAPLLWSHFSAAPDAPRLSIAVLPFRNLGGGSGQDDLADAISDDLTTDLSHIPGSVVIARASADTFRDRTMTADAIGRALKVRYLLEGSLLPEGSSLHINAQLIDAPSGGHLWARAFDVPKNRLGAARAEIVRSIASALDIALVDIESARSLRDRPRTADAVDFFLRARAVASRGNTLGDLSKAQDLLEKALVKSPDSTDALAVLGTVLVRKVVEFDDPADERDFARAQTVIARAVMLAPQNAAAITAKGYLAWADGKCGQAKLSFQMALSLDPDDLAARKGMAVCARQLGQMQDMIDAYQDLLRIDPANPENPKRQEQIGYGYLMLGNAGQALLWLQRAGAGLPQETPQDLAQDPAQDLALGWQEWRQIYLIAAQYLTGDRDGAARRAAAFALSRPHRTVWRLAAYDGSDVMALPGRAPFWAALRAAGMPDHQDEHEDFGVKPATAPQEGGDFAPTPLDIHGATRIDSAALAALLARPGPAWPGRWSWMSAAASPSLRDRCGPAGTCPAAATTGRCAPSATRVWRRIGRSWSRVTAPQGGAATTRLWRSLRRDTVPCCGTGAATKPGLRRVIPPRPGGCRKAGRTGPAMLVSKWEDMSLSGSIGGGKGNPVDPGPHTQPSGFIHITPILPVYPGILDGLTKTEIKAVRVAQLSYSQDICTRAALAYQQILAIVSAA
jgi:TolB-like protein/DNA-binding winged helix-turn-helix (wHTH) protein/cytochrome c-type biogenesis protein CcmH/NrfG